MAQLLARDAAIHRHDDATAVVHRLAHTPVIGSTASTRRSVTARRPRPMRSTSRNVTTKCGKKSRARPIKVKSKLTSVPTGCSRRAARGGAMTKGRGISSCVLSAAAPGGGRVSKTR
jgi:hypothetical protein